MDIPNNLRYRATHEWASTDGDEVTVGITDYAQDQLGDVVFVELPEAGRRVTAGDTVAVIESVKTASDIYAPVTGEITAVNGSLMDSPETINESPYEGGWLFVLQPEDPEAAEDLLSAEDYDALVQEI